MNTRNLTLVSKPRKEAAVVLPGMQPSPLKTRRPRLQAFRPGYGPLTDRSGELLEAVRPEAGSCSQGLRVAIAAFRDAFTVELATTPHRTREAFRLRHQVYCRERGYEPDTGGLETDEFDRRARHVILRERQGGLVIGTVRLVLPAPGRTAGLPMQRVCEAGRLDILPRATLAEVSRFALSRELRDPNSAAAPVLRLGLVQGLVRLSRDLGLTHWCAIMERSLLRLLRSTGIHFTPMGPCVEYHGLRQPAYAALDPMLARMAREHPVVWDLLTDGGQLWHHPPALPSVA